MLPPQEQKPKDNTKAKLVLDFLFEQAKDRPEWVGKYFKNVNESFDIDKVDLVDLTSFNPESRWLRGKDKKKFPRFILNEEIKDTDFYKTATPQILCGEMDVEFQDWITKYRDSHFQENPKRWQVFRYLIDKYGATHHFPGLDYLKYLTDTKTLIPTNNPDYQYYFLPGCMFYDKDGILDLLSVSNHSNTNVRPNFFDLDGFWGTSNEVVLFRK